MLGREQEWVRILIHEFKQCPDFCAAKSQQKLPAEILQGKTSANL